jgi:Zn-dependent protease
MMQAFWTTETAVVLGLLALAFLWAARPVQRKTMSLALRASRQDVWDSLALERGAKIHLDMIDRYEFDEGSDHDGVMVMKNGMRLRFETTESSKEGDIWRAAWRCVEIDRNGAAHGDPYETEMALEQAPDGVKLSLAYLFLKGDHSGPKVWLSRLMRPLMPLQAGVLLRQGLEKSGGFARYDAIHGPAPRPATFMGAPLTVKSALLFAAGTASFIWLTDFWAGIAILVILVLHELGHVLAMRAFGDRTSVFYLVPFMGGVAIGQKEMESDWRLVLMVLAGPFAGLLTALAGIALFHMTDNGWFAGFAVMAAIINVFNLLPIPMLDGGQVLIALLRRYLPHGLIRWISIGLLLAGAGLGAWIGSTLLVTVMALSAALQAAFPAAPFSTSRRPLSHVEAAAALAALLLSAAALLLSAYLVINGDAYPDNPLRLLERGPFAE